MYYCCKSWMVTINYHYCHIDYYSGLAQNTYFWPAVTQRRVTVVRTFIIKCFMFPKWSQEMLWAQLFQALLTVSVIICHRALSVINRILDFHEWLNIYEQQGNIIRYKLKGYEIKVEIILLSNILGREEIIKKNIL